MPTLEQLESAFRKADAAGNAEDAKAFASEIRRMRGSETGSLDDKKEKEPKSIFDVDPNAPKKDPFSFYHVDPKEWQKAQQEVGLGFLSGLGQIATGVGESLPGKAGEASARGTKALEQIGVPESQTLGKVLGSMAPASALFRGVSALGKSIPQLPSLLGGAQRIAGGGLSGLTAGGLTGFFTPTGEEDPNKRFKKKQEAALIEGMVGGALGGGVRAVGEAANAYKYVQGLISEAEQLSQSLRGQVGARAGQYIAETEQQVAAANTRLGRITEAVAELEARSALEVERRAQARFGESTYVDDPKRTSSIQRDAVARVRERVSAAQKAAEEAGMQKGEAADYVARQEAILLEQKAAAENITLNLQKALEEGKTVTPVQLAQEVRKTAVDIYKKVKGDRERVAGFGKAVEGAGEELRVNTSDVLGTVDALKKTSNNPNLDRVLDEISKRLSTKVEGAEKPVDVLSVARADSLRKYVVGLIDTSQNKAAAAQLGLDKEAVSALKKVRSALTKETMNSWDPYKDAMVNFAKLSGPVRPFERKGQFAKIVAEDPTTRDQLAYEGQILNEVLNRSKGGQFPIANLIEQQPELRNSLRAYYHRELFEGGTPTINRLSGFLKKNEDVLRQTGLYEEFSTIKSARQAADRAVAETEGLISAGKERVKELTGEQKRLEDILKGETRLFGKAQEREAAVAAEKPTRQKIKEASEEKTKEAADRLAEQRTKTLGEKEAAEQTVRQYKDMVSDLDRAEGPKIAEEAGKIVTDLRNRNLINDVDREMLMQKIQIAQKRATNIEEAKKYIKAGIYLTLSSAGLGGTGYFFKNQIADLFSGGQ